MNGWFAVNRAMFEHPLFAGKPDRIAAWLWIIATAAWAETRQNANGKIITIKRGQLLTSYRQMSKATGVSVKTLRNLISALTDQDAIGHETGTGRLLITVRNYEKYQSPPDQKGTRRAHEGHTKGTQKNNGTIEQDSVSKETGASAPSAEVSSFSLQRAVWEVGKPYLSAHGVKNPGQLIGKWLKVSSAVSVLQAIEAAQTAGTQDPIPYITKILQPEPEPVDVLAMVRERRARGEA